MANISTLPTRMNAVGKNVPVGGPAARKTTVIGMVQRGDGKRESRAHAMVVPNHNASSFIPRIYEDVVTGPGATPTRCVPTAKRIAISSTTLSTTAWPTSTGALIRTLSKKSGRA